MISNKYEFEPTDLHFPSGDWMLFPFTFYNSRWLNYYYYYTIITIVTHDKTFGLCGQKKHQNNGSQITSDSGLLEASALEWKIFLT